jgi:hypothetical protein
MKILIKVTKDVLKRSAHCCVDDINTNCAIAVAVRDLLPFATVGYECINLAGKAEPILQPSKMHRWITAFDMMTPEQRLRLPEVSFEVELQNEHINLIGIGEVYRILSESKTLELVIN